MALENGYCFQLICYGNFNDQEGLSEIATDVASRFKFLDPDRVLHILGEPVAPFKDESPGLEIDLSAIGWTEYPSRESDYPEARFCASKGSFSTGVSTVNLGTLDPGIDQLASGFLAHGFGMKHPSATKNRKEITQGSASGISFTAESANDDGSFKFAFRLLREGQQA